MPITKLLFNLPLAYLIPCFFAAPWAEKLFVKTLPIICN